MTDEGGPIIGSGATWTGGASEKGVVTFEVSFPGTTTEPPTVEFDVEDKDEPEVVAENLKNAWNKKYPANTPEAKVHNKVTVTFVRNAKEPEKVSG